MQNQPSPPPKPVSEVWRPELTRLPEYTLWRKLARRLLLNLGRFVVWSRLRVQARGLENFPSHGPGLIVLNHLGDADIIVILSQLRLLDVDLLGASKLYDILALRIVAQMYGVIWLHRGRPDRRALSCALEALRRGRFVTIAPEGRESLTGSLEQGLDGAAFLALRADVPVIPFAVLGTDNRRIYHGLTRWPRMPVSMAVGEPFRLAKTGNHHEDLKNGTEQIMNQLARLLPEEYQGVYRDSIRVE